MLRRTLRIAMVAGFIGLGWAAGKAQTSEPDFEVIVRAPEGETTIECVRGCTLAWVERGLNPQSMPTQRFTFRCSGAADSRCSSMKVGGWIGR